MTIKPQGINSHFVGIGTEEPDATLTVKGKIHTYEVLVDTDPRVVPDYVFNNEYKLLSLKEVELYIQENKHLPEVPSAIEIGENGLQLKEMNLLLLRKIEELTLYMIAVKKDYDSLDMQLKEQKALIQEQRAQIDMLLKK